MAGSLTNETNNFERQLLANVALGDQLAFSKLFNSYAPKLAQYVFRMTESLEASEEIVQDTFIVIWQKRATLIQLDSFSNYIFIISKNKTLNYLRKKAVDRKKQIEWLNQLEDEFDQIDQKSEKEDLCILIDNAVEKLPAQQKLVYTLGRVNKLKYHEIAHQLGLSKETVKKHMKLALLHLRTNLKVRNENSIFYIIFGNIFFF